MTKISPKILGMIEKACEEWDKPWSKMPEEEREMARDDYIRICYEFLSESVSKELGMKWEEIRFRGIGNEKI